MPDMSEDFAHGFARVVEGDDELVLQEAAFPVHAVPVVYGVEGIEEWVVGDCFMDSFAHLGVVVEFVKGFYGYGVERERWGG